ncbi:MAG: hypothetical protein IJ400_03090 [Clostridia bacterium]|nr:hypothetical protein [Clostridia bacterium]
MKKAKIVSFCGIISALSVVFLMLGSLINVMDMTMAVVASILLLVVFEEIRYKCFFVYFVTAVVGAIICPDKLVVVEYVIFALYPIVKLSLEKTSRAVSLLVRIAYSLLAGGGVVLLSSFVFLNDTNPTFDAIFLAGLLLIFILLDVAVKRFIVFYRKRLRHRLRIDKFFD